VSVDPFEWLARECEQFTESLRDLPVAHVADAGEVRADVQQALDLDQPTPLAEVLHAAADLMRRHATQVTHPRYFGLFNPTAHRSSIFADALTALYNPQVGGWSHAPAANEIERATLERLAVSLGLDPGTTVAHFTSGGNEANHTAVVTALAARYPEWSTGGLRALGTEPVIYVSRESHHSFVKVARATGLGLDALAHVDVDERLRMDPEALEGAIVQHRERGCDPVMVVATAGTTGSGAIDPLLAIADVCARHRVWYHVDAAWGGSAALAPRLRPLLAGIERADSVTWDAHKWLSVSLGAGMFFTRHPEALAAAFGVDTGYVPPTEEGTVDLYKTTMQWSRRFIGLKVWFLLAEHGVHGVGEIVDAQARVGDRLRELLQDAGWVVVNETPFPLICFTHECIESGERTIDEVLEGILARERVWISQVALANGRRALRACITSYRTDESDLQALMQELEEAIS
jgi:glutamate/tyrosine decarboxylase-like PLP-dependent enzyme